MYLTKTELKVLKYIYQNRNRNRKLTRGNMSREMGHSCSIIYTTSSKLYSKDMISYYNIDSKKKQILLTLKGEEYIFSLYKN